MTEDSSQSAHDLDWQAFCYLSGDLPAEGAAAFEARLADDQTAREALARAVEIGAAVYACQSAEVNKAPEPQVAVARLLTPASAQADGAGWLRPVAWMSVGAAACLVIVLAVAVVRKPPAADSAGNGARLADAAALLWSESRSSLGDVSAEWPLDGEGQEVEGFAAADSQLSELDGVGPDEVLPADDAVAEDSSLDEAPAWMIAGVTGGVAADSSTPDSETEGEVPPGDAPDADENGIQRLPPAPRPEEREADVPPQHF